MSFSEERSFDQLIVDLVDGVKTPHQNKDQRNKSIYLGFHGVHGGEGTTLDEQGKIHGDITRECVRQIVANIQAQLYLSDEHSRWIKQMISVIRTKIPCDLESLTEELKNNGFLSVEVENPRGLINLAFTMLREKPSVKFQSSGERTFVCPKSSKDMIGRVKSEFQKTVGKYGACSLSGICIRSGLTAGKENKRFVSQVIETVETAEFLTDEWVTCDPGYKDRLTKRLERVFSVYRSVEVKTLYQVMARSLRQIKETVKSSPEFKAFGFGNLQAINEERIKEGKEPLNRKPFLGESQMKMAFDLDVFTLFVARINGLEIVSTDSGTFVVASSRILADESPSPVVMKTISLLNSKKDKKLRESEIRDSANLTEKEWYSFITASNFSPYISRVHRGTYKTLGELFG